MKELENQELENRDVNGFPPTAGIKKEGKPSLTSPKLWGFHSLAVVIFTQLQRASC